MIYSEDEIRAWWKSLSELDRDELFLKMMERAPTERFAEFAESLRDQWNQNKSLSFKQLLSIKKWDRK